MIGIIMPAYNGMNCVEATIAILQARDKFPLVFSHHCSSALCLSFNGLLQTMYRQSSDLSISHIVMMHNDVAPLDPNWLPSMMHELDGQELDVLSAFCPIKDNRGLTNTAVERRHEAEPGAWCRKRFTVTELPTLPPTIRFDDGYLSEFIGGRDTPRLLINTGLMLMRVGRWMKDVVFDTRNHVRFDADGQPHIQFESEDWEFSRWMFGRTIPYGVTSVVPVAHACALGTFRSDVIYGQEHDNVGIEFEIER